MKTKFLAVLLLFAFFAFKANAQSPAVLALRDAVKGVPSKFEKLKGDKIGEEDGRIKYKTKLEHAGAESFIVNFPSGNTQYFIIYRIHASNPTLLKLQTLLVTQYVEEINAMVKSGEYSGNDRVEDGENITTLTNAAGRQVLQLRSSGSFFAIILFS